MKRIERFVEAALCQKPVTGLTHTFYTYPARFSPSFAASAIECFSKPGDLVLDPYMGGGTTIVEAMVAGRRAVGVDLNSLAVFIARVKTSRIGVEEIGSLKHWAEKIVPLIRYNYRSRTLHRFIDDDKTKNLNLKSSRFIKKTIAVALESLDVLPTVRAKDFAKCAILCASKWALDGKRTHTSVSNFRERLSDVTLQMIEGMEEFMESAKTFRKTLIEGNAEEITNAPVFSNPAHAVDLVVTSPPYPGVHVLYHRWQVDGRKETPAPYWIAGCQDGEGASFYNFGGRKQKGLTRYFLTSLRTLKTIRQVMKKNAFIVQMVAFSNPAEHLPLYLRNMTEAGFEELFPLACNADGTVGRIWRNVPNRKWHARLKGATHSSKEVVLIHRRK